MIGGRHRKPLAIRGDKNHFTVNDVRRLARKPGRISWDQMCKTKRDQSQSKNQISKVRVKIENQENDSVKKFTVIKDKKLSVIAGKKLEAILAVIKKDGRLFHLVKWKGSNHCDLVDSDLVNNQWPTQVIAYYQKNLKFPSKPKNLKA